MVGDLQVLRHVCHTCLLPRRLVLDAHAHPPHTERERAREK